MPAKLQKGTDASNSLIVRLIGNVMNITVQEFDKKIAESEANTAELKKQGVIQ